MRLDVSVNMLTYQALKNNKITVLVAIKQDLIFISKIWQIFISTENLNLESGCYNAGFENMKIIDIAKKVQSIRR